MNEDAINKFSQCLLDSAQLRITGPMEANIPLYTAQEIKSHLTINEFREAAKRSVLNLLKHNFLSEAVYWIQEFKEFPELADDLDIKQEAKKQYQNATKNQYEHLGNFKAIFKI